jgi:hypothetical protein
MSNAFWNFCEYHDTQSHRNYVQSDSCVISNLPAAPQKSFSTASWCPICQLHHRTAFRLLRDVPYGSCMMPSMTAAWFKIWKLHSDLYRMDSLYRASTCACMERGNITSGAKIYIYIAAGLDIKKMSFPFSVHHSSYNTRLLSTKGESAISLMQWRTCTNVLRRAI